MWLLIYRVFSCRQIFFFLIQWCHIFSAMTHCPSVFYQSWSLGVRLNTHTHTQIFLGPHCQSTSISTWVLLMQPLIRYSTAKRTVLMIPYIAPGFVRPILTRFLWCASVIMNQCRAERWNTSVVIEALHQLVVPTGCNMSWWLAGLLLRSV